MSETYKVKIRMVDDKIACCSQMCKPDCPHYSECEEKEILLGYCKKCNVIRGEAAKKILADLSRPPSPEARARMEAASKMARN